MQPPEITDIRVEDQEEEEKWGVKSHVGSKEYHDSIGNSAQFHLDLFKIKSVDEELSLNHPENAEFFQQIIKLQKISAIFRGPKEPNKGSKTTQEAIESARDTKNLEEITQIAWPEKAYPHT